jgi:hypothetical protein
MPEATTVFTPPTAIAAQLLAWARDGEMSVCVCVAEGCGFTLFDLHRVVSSCRHVSCTGTASSGALYRVVTRKSGTTLFHRRNKTSM